MSTCRYPVALMEKFEFHSYGHAMEILLDSFSGLWDDVVMALSQFQITTEELKQSGGNETEIPKKFDNVLYPKE